MNTFYMQNASTSAFPRTSSGAKRFYPYDFESLETTKQVKMDPSTPKQSYNNGFIDSYQDLSLLNIPNQNPFFSPMQNSLFNDSFEKLTPIQPTNTFTEKVEEVLYVPPEMPKFAASSQNLSEQEMLMICHKLEDECKLLNDKLMKLLFIKKQLQSYNVPQRQLRNKNTSGLKQQDSAKKLIDEKNLLFLNNYTDKRVNMRAI